MARIHLRINNEVPSLLGQCCRVELPHKTEAVFRPYVLLYVERTAFALPSSVSTLAEAVIFVK